MDERGFRATGFAPPDPAASPSRVAFLGDSCTFGWNVDTRETFVAQLSSIQRSVAPDEPMDLVNGGFPGDSAVAGFYKLRERVLPLAPDLVVLGFSAHNAFRFSLFCSVAMLLKKVPRSRARPSSPLAQSSRVASMCF